MKRAPISPAKFEVHRGDVIRFTLKTGVHNIDFLPDSNPGPGHTISNVTRTQRRA
jgi:plastocyanin